ncbi:hypothetical protein EC951288_2902A, partial [Escherichia coli 95.1288]
MADIIDS